VPRTHARDALGARIKDAFEQARAGAFANEGGLAALFGWLQTEKANGMLPALLRKALEQALEGMVAAREIRVRRVPAVENDGSESIYFTIPTGGDAPPLLQITFERDHAPTQEEFDLLAEAAVRAADLLQ
jgi:hypothetical protein